MAQNNTVISDVTTELEKAWDVGQRWAADLGADWALWLGVAFSLTIGVRIGRAFLGGLFRARHEDAGKIRNLIANILKATNSLVIFVFALSLTAPFLVELTEKQRDWLDAAVMVSAVAQVAFWVRVVIRAVMEGVIARQAEDSATFRSARSLISMFINIAVFGVAIVMIIDNLGGDVTGLIAGLGVGGIAIGLAAQNIFKDLFASMSIILDKPFVKGDFIQFDGFLGTVQQIGLKTTQIESLRGEQLVVGNSELLSNVIQNYARMKERRVVLQIGVTYDTPRRALEQLPGQIRDVVQSTDNSRFDRCHVSEYGASSIGIELVYYVLSGDFGKHMDIKQEVSLGIHRVLEEQGIEFAFPTQTVVLQRGDKEAS